MTQELALLHSGLGLNAGDEAVVTAAIWDGEAFGELYTRHLPRVYRYLRTRTESANEASDLTQAAFLRAFAVLAAYRPERTPFSAWLFRIARNASIDAHRRRRATVPWELLSEIPRDPDGISSPEANAECQGRAAPLRALVGRHGGVDVLRLIN